MGRGGGESERQEAQVRGKAYHLGEDLLGESLLELEASDVSAGAYPAKERGESV
jgi:hypothetical protein